MSKKLFGGISLLIFVMTLLVFTNNSYSHGNRQDWYEHITNYTCPNGEIAFSSTRWVVVRWSQDHPADDCHWEKHCWNALENWKWVRKCKWVEVCHVDHGITYRVYRNYRITTRSGTPNNCRRFR